LAVERKRQPLFAIGGLIGDMAYFTQGPDDVVGGVTVVFDYQEAHCR
jgi:hypothetical protein